MQFQLYNFSTSQLNSSHYYTNSLNSKMCVKTVEKVLTSHCSDCLVIRKQEGFKLRVPLKKKKLKFLRWISSPNYLDVSRI